MLNSPLVSAYEPDAETFPPAGIKLASPAYARHYFPCTRRALHGRIMVEGSGRRRARVADRASCNATEAGGGTIREWRTLIVIDQSARHRAMDPDGRTAQRCAGGNTDDRAC